MSRQSARVLLARALTLAAVLYSASALNQDIDFEYEPPACSSTYLAPSRVSSQKYGYALPPKHDKYWASRGFIRTDGGTDSNVNKPKSPSETPQRFTLKLSLKDWGFRKFLMHPLDLAALRQWRKSDLDRGRVFLRRGQFSPYVPPYAPNLVGSIVTIDTHGDTPFLDGRKGEIQGFDELPGGASTPVTHIFKVNLLPLHFNVSTTTDKEAEKFANDANNFFGKNDTWSETFGDWYKKSCGNGRAAYVGIGKWEHWTLRLGGGGRFIEIVSKPMTIFRAALELERIQIKLHEIKEREILCPDEPRFQSFLFHDGNFVRTLFTKQDEYIYAWIESHLERMEACRGRTDANTILKSGELRLVTDYTSEELKTLPRDNPARYLFGRQINSDVQFAKYLLKSGKAIESVRPPGGFRGQPRSIFLKNRPQQFELKLTRINPCGETETGSCVFRKDADGISSICTNKTTCSLTDYESCIDDFLTGNSISSSSTCKSDEEMPLPQCNANNYTFCNVSAKLEYLENNPSNDTSHTFAYDVAEPVKRKNGQSAFTFEFRGKSAEMLPDLVKPLSVETIIAGALNDKRVVNRQGGSAYYFLKLLTTHFVSEKTAKFLKTEWRSRFYPLKCSLLTEWSGPLPFHDELTSMGQVDIGGSKDVQPCSTTTTQGRMSRIDTINGATIVTTQCPPLSPCKAPSKPGPRCSRSAGSMDAVSILPSVSSETPLGVGVEYA